MTWRLKQSMHVKDARRKWFHGFCVVEKSVSLFSDNSICGNNWWMKYSTQVQELETLGDKLKLCPVPTEVNCKIGQQMIMQDKNK